MSEITKLYENAGIEPDINYVCDKDPCEKHSVNCQECSHIYDTREDYPDFTAEKQLELIKWLMKHDEIHGEYNDGYGFSTLNYSGKYKKDFEESLASVINNEIWQVLTPEEKQQVKGILE